MSNQWAQVRLGEVCDVIPGFAFKSKDWSKDGVPVVKIKNIVGDGSVDMSGTDCIPREIFTDKLQKFLLQDGDILLAMTGATAGKVGRLRVSGPALLNQRVAKIVPKEVDSEYLWAVVSSAEYERRFFRLADGAAQPNMSGGQIEGVLIPLPPSFIQRRIGSILGAYDDLIEMNRRRIAVLEEMARRLFEEWFVQFRFPGHEDVPLVPVGEARLPQGWRSVAFGSLAAEVRDAIDPRDLDGVTPYVGLEHIPRRSTTLDNWGRTDEVSSLKLRFGRGDVLFGKIRPYFHKVAWAPFAGVSSSDAIVFRSKSADHAGLVLAVASSDQFVAHSVQTSNGTKMPRANPGVLARYPVPLPPIALLRRFNGAVLTWVEMAATLNAANWRLAASRDLLLPRLISGELSITAAERELENAA